MTISYYNGNVYQKRSELTQMEGFILASLASGAILSPLALAGKSFEKAALKEQVNNTQYKDALLKSLEISGLKDKGVEIIPAQHFSHIYPIEAAGKNAFYNGTTKKVVINTEKMAVAGFHELGHAMNHLMSKSGKFLQKMRWPGYAIAGLMEYFAIFSRTKPKEAKKSPTDYIEDKCGKIAFIAMLPTAIEEAIASRKGIQLAKKAGVDDHLIKNMKKVLKKAWLTYAGKAVLGGLAVGASRMIMDKFTRPKKIEDDSWLF